MNGSPSITNPQKQTCEVRRLRSPYYLVAKLINFSVLLANVGPEQSLNRASQSVQTLFSFCSSYIQYMFKFKPCSDFVQLFGIKFELCSPLIQLLFNALGRHTGEAKFVQPLFMTEVKQWHRKECIHWLFELFYLHSNFVHILFKFKLCSYLIQIQILFKFYSWLV